MCTIVALVSVLKGSTAHIMVSWENIKRQETSYASIETSRFDAVNFLGAVFVGLTIKINFQFFFFVK